MLLAAVERTIGVAERFAGLIADPRNPAFITHSVADILRARMLAIACGYEDADDLDHLRGDPGFKLLVAVFLIAASICALSPRSRAGRTRPPCVR